MGFEICKESLMAISDTLYVVGGKWKLPIVFALSFGEMRFGELERGIPKITARMLSKELKELEQNQIIKRATEEHKVVYRLTVHGESLKEIFEPMKEWGLKHRDQIFNQSVEA